VDLARLAAEEAEGLREAGGGEPDGVDLERMVAEMKAVRAAAQRQGLTDAERRENAARLAMQMMALLGEED
jgi:hypothetical protein